MGFLMPHQLHMKPQSTSDYYISVPDCDQSQSSATQSRDHLQSRVHGSITSSKVTETRFVTLGLLLRQVVCMDVLDDCSMLAAEVLVGSLNFRGQQSFCHSRDRANCTMEAHTHRTQPR